MAAPAVAARGLPVMAIQFLPCKGGFCVCCAVEIKKSEQEKRNAIMNFIKESCCLKIYRKMISDLATIIYLKWLKNQTTKMEKCS